MKQVIVKDYHSPQNLLGQNPEFSITWVANNKQIPQEIRKTIATYWNGIEAKNPKAQDNPTANLEHYTRNAATVTMIPYSFNQFFNRSNEDDPHAQFAIAHKLVPLSSWMFPITADERFGFFGTRKDIASRSVSSLGGYANHTDFDKSSLNFGRYISRVFSNEAKELTKHIVRAEKVGLSYSPEVGPTLLPRGYDGIYTITIDGDKEFVESKFTENNQFSKKGFTAVPLNPVSLVDFLNDTRIDPTKTTVGGVLAYIGSTFGPKELERAVARYNPRVLPRIE